MRQVEAKEQQNVANAMLHVLEAIDYPLCFLVRRRRSHLPSWRRDSPFCEPSVCAAAAGVSDGDLLRVPCVL